MLIEQPTYFDMIDTLQLNNVTNEGIDFRELENLFQNNDIKFFYITPRCHNPPGHHYTNEEKKEIVALAKKYDITL